MKKLIVFLTLSYAFLTVSNVFANDESPPTKTTLSNAQQTKLLNEATELTSTWTGSGDNLERAATKITEILDANPGNISAHILLAYVYLAAGNMGGGRVDPRFMSKAQSEAGEALKLDQKSPKANILQANIDLKNGRPFIAMLHLQEAEKYGGTDFFSFYTLAINTNLELGHPELAENMLKRFEEFQAKKNNVSKADRKSLYLAQISIYADTNPDKADEAYRKNIDLDPEVAWAHGDYASFLLYSRGNVDQAIKEATSALNIMDYGMAENVLASAKFVKGVEISKTSRQGGDKYITEAMGNGIDINHLLVNAAEHSGDSQEMKDTVIYLTRDKSRSVDAQDEIGNTGLIRAASNNKIKSVEWLLKNGADPETKNHNGHNVMYVACDNNYPDAVKMLGKFKVKTEVSDKVGLTPLGIAIVHNFKNVVDALMVIGASPNYKGTSNDPNKYYPLMLAAQIGNIDIVKALLNAGADPGIRLPANSSMAGMSAAEIADAKGNKEIAQLIRQSKPHVSMSSKAINEI